jgi:hypothetical protein
MYIVNYKLSSIVFEKVMNCLRLNLTTEQYLGPNISGSVYICKIAMWSTLCFTKDVSTSG